MSKGSELYLEDILGCIQRIERYTAPLDEKGFLAHEMAQDAVIRNLEVIGEAVKRLPKDLKESHDEVDWRKAAGLRHVLIHQYGGIDLRIVRDIVQNSLPALR